MGTSEVVVTTAATNPRARRRDEQGKFVSGYRDPNATRSLALKNNMNRVTRPWALFARRRMLPPRSKWALAIYQEHLAGTASDKPGMSEAETRAAEVGAMARACEALLLTRMADPSCKPEEQLDLLHELRGFATLELKALSTLGLQRRARPVDLSGYLEGRREAPPDPPVA